MARAVDARSTEEMKMSQPPLTKKEAASGRLGPGGGQGPHAAVHALAFNRRESAGKQLLFLSHNNTIKFFKIPIAPPSIAP
jgi:hypothetical protein